MSKKFDSFSMLSLFLSSNSLQSKLYWFVVSGQSHSAFLVSGTKFVFQRSNSGFTLYNNNDHVFITVPNDYQI